MLEYIQNKFDVHFRNDKGNIKWWKILLLLLIGYIIKTFVDAHNYQMNRGIYNGKN